MSETASTIDDLDRPPAQPRSWPRQRVVGFVLMGLWIVFGLGLAAFLIASWNPELFARYAGSYLSGLIVTVQLVSISIVLGAILSAPIAFARMSRNRLLSWPAYAYV